MREYDSRTAAPPEDGRDEPQPSPRGGSALISRSVDAARTRAEERIQRFLDAAFELVDEKGSTEFTVQELLERSKQSLRGFYEYFGSKDELVLALFEETVREAAEDIRGGGRARARAHARLRAFVITLHEWCDPARRPASAGRTRGDRSPSCRCSWPPTTPTASAPRCSRSPASCATSSTRRPTPGSSPSTTAGPRCALVLQTVMYSWFGNRLVENSRPARRTPRPPGSSAAGLVG